MRDILALNTEEIIEDDDGSGEPKTKLSRSFSCFFRIWAGTQEDEWSSHELANIVQKHQILQMKTQVIDSIIEWKKQKSEIRCSQSDISYYQSVFAEIVKKKKT